MVHPLVDLTGKAALVTGGTRGLGRAVAQAFLQAGARVAICSEDGDACVQAEAQMRAQGDANVFARRCDVTVEADQKALVAETLDRFGGLDLLVANAGVPGAYRGSLGTPAEEYERVMRINLHSVVGLCALAVGPMRARGGGSIIVMSSLSALRGNRAIGVYALTKAALAQLARNLAVEFGSDNIRANAIAPGFIRTDLAAGRMADEAFMARRMQNTPLRRPGEPDEVAGAALFLAGRGGGFTTGQTLVVDGGTLITDGT